MKDYEINRSTLILIPLDEDKTNVIEDSRELIVNLPIMKIIDNSCRFFGSSYDGRLIGTKEILGVSSKAPIIIEESKRIIFFPTTSPRVGSCIWISLNNIKDYRKNKEKISIDFSCGKTINLDISYNVIDNQVLRSTRLYFLLEKRMI